MGFPSASDGKESACSAGDLDLILGRIYKIYVNYKLALARGICPLPLRLLQLWTFSTP